MSTNATVAAIIGALAPIVAAVVVLFKLNLTADQQAELVAGLAAVVTASAAIYASVAHHGAAQVKVAQANASAFKVSTSGSSATGTYAFTTPAKPAARKRPSRAKKTPPAA